MFNQFGKLHNGEQVISKVTFQASKNLYTAGAQFIEVEVNTETGKVTVTKIVSANDIGRVINLSCLEGQIQGASIQGLGYALTEELIVDNETGAVKNPNFTDYKIPLAIEIPQFIFIPIETISPTGPFGAKGASEMALVPMAAAITNAIYNATGIRMNELPITPEKIIKELRNR